MTCASCVGRLEKALRRVDGVVRDGPLLFLDVDGTLLPFAGASLQMSDDANPLLPGLDPEHGRRLTALPCELVRATSDGGGTMFAVGAVTGSPVYRLPAGEIVAGVYRTDDPRFDVVAESDRLSRPAA